MPGRVTVFSHVGIVPGDTVGLRVFSGISCFPRPSIPVLLHTRITSPSSALKTSLLRAAQISSLTPRAASARDPPVPALRAMMKIYLLPSLFWRVLAVGGEKNTRSLHLKRRPNLSIQVLGCSDKSYTPRVGLSRFEVDFGIAASSEFSFKLGATVAERLDSPPPPPPQPRPGHSRIFVSENRARRCRWSAGFLGDVPFPPAPCVSTLLHSHRISPASAPKTSFVFRMPELALRAVRVFVFQLRVPLDERAPSLEPVRQYGGDLSKEESEPVNKRNCVMLEMERTRRRWVNLLCRANLTIRAKYMVATQNIVSSETDLLTNSQCDNRSEHPPRRRHRGANPRPSDYKSATLPLSYDGRASLNANGTRCSQAALNHCPAREVPPGEQSTPRAGSPTCFSDEFRGRRASPPPNMLSWSPRDLTSRGATPWGSGKRGGWLRRGGSHPSSDAAAADKMAPQCVDAP
ncbi:hypothetical protein PR048_030742 [Dryococelus australis]|uniref:Uncharacterized protein n=1 Tax=Dryococelus australis TaxID=614101 RepID=A0ABQ9GCG2_9NEOP|nr:hypothetical protein PR048_030742 [Dryococelus australis]